MLLGGWKVAFLESGTYLSISLKEQGVENIYREGHR